MPKPTIDVEVSNEGSVVLFTPLTEDARAWIDENVQSESWQWLGASLAVDHRFAMDLLNGMAGAGLVLA